MTEPRKVGAPKGHVGNPRGGHSRRPPSRHPANAKMIDHEHKCAYAAKLRFEYGMHYAQIAEQLWPLDAAGNPAPGAKRLFASRQAVWANLLRWGKTVHAEIKDEAIVAIVSRASARHAKLSELIGLNSIEACAEARQTDEMLAKLFGLFAPTKTQSEFSGPDGKPIEVTDPNAPRERIAGRIAGIAARLREGGDTRGDDVG